jgi:GNAT superfamily N-acetyltransferase
MWCVRPNLPIGVGRMHLCGPGEAQIRFMGVLDCWRNSGIGTSLVEALEAEARKRGAIRMVLNARIDASGFYESLGYQIEGPGPLLFGEIPHVRMTRDLTRAVSSPKPKPVLTV